MKKIINLIAVLLVCLGTYQTVQASSHREAPLIANDPLADNTDVYAFKSPCDTTKIVLIANYIPFELPNGGPNYYTFGENIRYEVHVDNNSATTGDDIIYRFTFKHVLQDSTTFFNIRLAKENLKATYSVDRSMDGGMTFTTILASGTVPPNNIGPRSITGGAGLAASSYEDLAAADIATAGTGEKFFCGPRDDAFFVDLGGAFDVGGFRASGRDGLAKYNCHSIVIEVPVSTLQKSHQTTAQATSILDPNYVIGVYASAYRQQTTTFSATGAEPATSGNWIQVSRLGMPLTNEAVIPIGMKDKWDASNPANDVQFAPYFNNPELALYMDDSQFGTAVPGLGALRIQTKSLGAYDFRNGKKGLYPLKRTSAVVGTALDSTLFGTILLPDSMSPRAVDLLPIFYTGVPNLAPYQLATGKGGNPLAPGKPFINNFLPTLGDYLRLNMAVPITPRSDTNFSSLGLVYAAVLGLTNPHYNASAALQFIPNMDGFPNGRRLEDDVTTIELQAVSGVVLAAIGLWYDDYIPGTSPSPVTANLVSVLSFNAGVVKNDTTLRPCFPYLQTPWAGYTGAAYVGPMATDALPVTWVSFSAAKDNNSVQLTWNVTNEVNNKYYTIEYSTDGITFNKISTLNAKTGTTNTYTYLHGSPSLTQTNFYRIRQTDIDGNYTYSPVRSVSFGSQNSIFISPNPATSYINIVSPQNNITIYIYDAAGKRMYAQQLTTGNGRVDISRFAKGIYTVVAETNGVRMDTRKIFKQ